MAHVSLCFLGGENGRWSLRHFPRGYRSKLLRPTVFHRLTCFREGHFGGSLGLSSRRNQSWIGKIVPGFAASASRIIKRFASLSPSRLYMR